MTVADWANMEEGYYLVAANVLVNNNRRLDNIIVFATPGENSVSLAVIYVGEAALHGLYYRKSDDSFVFNYAWGNYSATTIANHINEALGSSFVGSAAIRTAEVDITKDDILGKLVPAEP